jgi:AraC-like DNA-binding protein
MKQRQVKLQLLTAVKQVIEERQDLNNVKCLATAFNVNRNSLQHAFKSEVGVGIREYKLKRRMELAQQMLHEGKEIKVIAFTLNYSKTCTFSRAFKKYFGVVPTEWTAGLQKASDMCKM